MNEVALPDFTLVAIVMMRSAARPASAYKVLFQTLLSGYELNKLKRKYLFVFTGMSYKELDERLENDPNIIICWK